MMKTRLPVPIRGVDRGPSNGSVSPPTHVSFKVKERSIDISEGKMDEVSSQAPVTPVGPGKATGTEPKKVAPKKMATTKASPSSLSSSSLSSFSNSTSSIGKSPRTPVGGRGPDGNGRWSSASNGNSRPSSSSSGQAAPELANHGKVYGNSSKKAVSKSSPKPAAVLRSHSNTETSTTSRNSPSTEPRLSESSIRSSGSSHSGASSKSPMKFNRDVSGKPFPIPVRNQKSPRSPSKDQKQFEPYMMLEEVQHGLKRGELIEGILRINPKSYEDAYISVPGGQMDIYIGGIRDRNRALNGDVVAVQINNTADWKIFGDRVVRSGPTPGRTRRPKCENPTTAPVPVPVLGKLPAKHRRKKPPKVPPKIDNDPNQPSASSALQATSTSNPETVADIEKSSSEITSNTKKKRKRPRRGNRKNENKLIPNSMTDVNGEEHELLPVVASCADNDSPLVDLSNVPPPTFHLSDKILTQSAVQFNLSEGKNENSALLASPTRNFGSIGCVDDGVGDDDDDAAAAAYDDDDDEFCGKIGQVVAPDQLSEVESICSESGDSTVCDVPDAEAVKSVTIDMKSLAEVLTLHKIDNKVKSVTSKESRKHKDLGVKNEIKEDLDTVVAPAMESPSSQLIQKTGKVVYILEQRNSRASCGTLKLMRDKNPNWALFSPRDHRVPRMHIPMSECPKDFYQRADAYTNQVFVAKIVDWQNTGNSRGKLCKSLGLAGMVEPESEAMLLENGVEFGELPDKLAEDGCIKLPWTIPDEEISDRKDLRDECIFTIDPSTARDLDDAVSCVHVRDDVYRVGVHIADVGYFVKDGSLLDSVAANRATSVYLVHKVVPMLPSVLCEKLCSLNPGVDRLAFSVEWLISSKGAIYDEWMGRTVIKSCAKLSYKHAQFAIENPDKELKADELPPLTGTWTWRDVSQKINQLQTIAVNLRKGRVKNGALRLDQTRLQFLLDPETGMPTGFLPYEHQDSNRLIEEFMLLANMAVAQKIYKHFPGQAMLRSHPQPDDRQLMEVIDSCANKGIDLDPTSAGKLQTSLTKLAQEHIDRENILPVLMHLLAKPMKCAAYFCSGVVEDHEDLVHYALSVPIYTHFTSPIRRYPDIIVHRQLAAALGLEELYCVDERELQKKAVHCNDKKARAKVVQEMSTALYLKIAIRDHGPFEEEAIVCAVMDYSFDVLILRMGIVKRVYCNNLPLKLMQFTNTKLGMAELELVWPARSADETDVTQIVGLFSKVKVLVVAAKDKDEIKVNAVLIRPT